MRYDKNYRWAKHSANEKHSQLLIGVTVYYVVTDVSVAPQHTQQYCHVPRALDL